MSKSREPVSGLLVYVPMENVTFMAYGNGGEPGKATVASEPGRTAGPFEVVAEAVPGMSAKAIASAVAAVRIGMSTGASLGPDWTISAETGRSNSSARYKTLCAEVEALLREGGGWCLDAGWLRSKAALIMAQLAHVHGLAPAAGAAAERDEEPA